MLDFSQLKPHQEDVIGDDGRKYVLLEPTCAASCAYENERTRGMKYDEKGKSVQIINLADSEPLLVAECLYKADEKGNLPVDSAGNPRMEMKVGLGIIRAWPDRIVQALYEKLLEWSPGLRPKAKRDVLEDRIKEAEKELAQLDAEAKNGTMEKNLLTDTTAISVSRNG